MSKNFSGGISSLISNGAQPEKQKAEKPKALLLLKLQRPHRKALRKTKRGPHL